MAFTCHEQQPSPCTKRGAEETDKNKQITKTDIGGKRYGEYNAGKKGREGAGKGVERGLILSQERPHWYDIGAKMTVVNFPLGGFPNIGISCKNANVSLTSLLIPTPYLHL